MNQLSLAHPDITDDEIAAALRVLRSGWLTTGEECRAFESELAEFVGARHVVTTASCTAALEIALAHLQLPPGSKVGVPTWTFAATALAAHRAGYAPVLLDVDEQTLNLSPASFERAAPALRAVVPVHFAGLPISPEIREIASDWKVAVVEDAAHAFGAADSYGRIGSSSQSGTCFSFYATKNLCTGEGGALATDDDSLDAFARRYRQHGMSTDAWARYRPGAKGLYDVVDPGIKGNMPDLLAAIGRAQLSRFASIQARRRAAHLQYQSRLADCEALQLLDPSDQGHAHHLAVVRLRRPLSASQVRSELADRGVPTSVHFTPLHMLTWFRQHLEAGPGGLPTASALTDSVFSLPLHPQLTTDDVAGICDIVLETTNRLVRG